MKAAKRKPMKDTTKSYLCRGGAFIIAAGVPIAASATYFDFFVQRSDTAISSIAMLALVIGAVSFRDTLLKYFKSPSALKIWLAIFILAFITSRISEQFVVIAAFGLAAQGAVVPLHMLESKYKKRADNKDLKEALTNAVATARTK